MAKPSKDRDRRAVVEAMRAEQKRAERRRTALVLVASLVIALIIIGAAAVPLLRQSKQAGRPLADLGVARTSASCSPVVTKKATGEQDHKPEGTQIDYADAPPAFGPHYPVTAGSQQKFYTADDRPKVANLVHNLEHGYTILWYDDTVAGDKTQVTGIRAIAKKFEDRGQKPTGKFIAAPWTSSDGKAFPKGKHVALSHWSTQRSPSDTSKQQGVWQYCGSISGAVVSTFTRDYPYSDSLEPAAQ